jgi:hypothetical protein
VIDDAGGSFIFPRMALKVLPTAVASVPAQAGAAAAGATTP